MGNNDLLIKSYGILGLFTQIFAGIGTSYIILLVLIILDTFTGIFNAIKCKKFSGTGLRKFIRKVITYGLSIITVRLLEIILNSIVTTMMLSEIIIAFLAIKESISILENLTLAGVPLPTNFLSLLINPLKIPILNTMLENSKNKEQDKEFSEIDYLINCQISNLHDKYTKKFLKIRYDACKSVISQIILLSETNGNPDILYYKVVNFVELALENSNNSYAENKIPTKYIENFSKNNNTTIFKFLAKLKITCYSGKTIIEKKDQIIDDIIIIIYQSIIDSREII